MATTTISDDDLNKIKDAVLNELSKDAVDVRSAGSISSGITNEDFILGVSSISASGELGRFSKAAFDSLADNRVKNRFDKFPTSAGGTIEAWATDSADRITAIENRLNHLPDGTLEEEINTMQDDIETNATKIATNTTAIATANTAITAIEAALAARKWVKVFDTTTMSGVGINLYDIERNGYRRVRVVAMGNQNIAGYAGNDRNEMAAFTVELDTLLTAARAKDAEGKPLMLINESTTSTGAKRENAQFGVPVPIEPTNPSKNCNMIFTLSTAAGMTFDDDDSPIGLYITVQKSYASATPAMWAAYVQRCD